MKVKKRIRGRYSNRLELRAVAAEDKLHLVMAAHERCIAWRDEEIRRLKRIDEMLKQTLAILVHDMPGQRLELRYADIDAEKEEHIIVAPHRETVEYIYMGEKEIKAIIAKAKKKAKEEVEEEAKSEKQEEPDQAQAAKTARDGTEKDKSAAVQ